MNDCVKLCILVLLTTAAASKIDHSLNKVLLDQGKANVFVSMKEGTAGVLRSFKDLTFANRGQKLTSLTNSLQNHAQAVQAPVFNLLADFPDLSVRSFWISNQVFIKEATLELVQRLAQIPSVSAIHEQEFTEIMMPVVESSEIFGDKPQAEEWGVSIIQAPEAWGLDGGNNGEGVVVATVDTGVRYTHEALRSNFLGEYGWFDPHKFTAEPNDQNGHGTHTTGTIAGQGGIGVAPGATWMACKGCATSSCAQDALLHCGQFILCPTLPDESKPDCSKAPHLVSNSWGGGQGREVYHDMIDAWIAGGIVTLFSNGNSGPRCGSAGSPADHPGVIGVGSTTNTDALSSFSSVGPSVYGDIKPDVSAPGSSVRSSYHSSDKAYATMSGTSMASPHAAGVVALLKSRDKEISIEDVKRHLYQAIDRDLTKPGKHCGGVSEDTWPNNAFGHGRVNALKSLVSLLEESS